MRKLVLAVFVLGSLLLNLSGSHTTSANPSPPEAEFQQPSPNSNIPNGTCNPEKIDFTPIHHSFHIYQGDTETFTVDACFKSGHDGVGVTLVSAGFPEDDRLETVTGIDGSKSARINFSLECDGRDLSGHDTTSKGFFHSIGIEISYDGKKNHYDNVGTRTGAMKVTCIPDTCEVLYHLFKNGTGSSQNKLWIDFDAPTGYRAIWSTNGWTCDGAEGDKQFNCSGKPIGAGRTLRLGFSTQQHPYVSSWNWGERGRGDNDGYPEQTCSSTIVGGIAELPEIAGSEAATSEPASTNYTLWMGIAVAGAVGALVLGTGLWFTRRRRPS